MADNNEIDDILNELKNKQSDKDRAANDFFMNFQPPEKDNNTEEPQGWSLNITDNEPSVDEPLTPPENFSLISSAEREEDFEPDEEEENKPVKKSINKKKKYIIIGAAIIAIILITSVAIAVMHGGSKEPETTTAPPTTVTTTEAPVIIANPLTGSKSFSEAAMGKRPVACVVENSYYARPQWGIDDSKNPPDIIIEGEVEGGESRMLWLYADYNSMPEQIGPMRSARPPFIRFSQLFDSIFVHWGMSTSKGNYVGANTVFKNENVDHINQMSFSDGIGLFSRDHSRNVSSEHTGVLHGAKLEQAFKNLGFRTDADESKYTTFNFSDKDLVMGETPCNTLGLKFSSSSNTRDWTYSAEDKMYHSSDYRTDVERKNLLVLFDNTAYIAKANYKGSGKSEIYCDYKLAGGNGKLASMGTVCDITWSVENGRLSVKDANGKDIVLNVGTTWIGWGSANNGGTLNIG